ncbi:DUF3318 domain-containing protein [Cupriavidus sp. AU9028]|uniref:DUF3318 domain-containing protein n=1 Tax=Cupriavidus sp. AU9028 TaxID=2871157 RepID=UPI001C988224|nr:DUF3318 domain-containing protein [Cupriavidus sp. AU9028]MBY4898179.1 DUF3318 domain-containing protein [Cupriavidus sp. AU9028]
MTANRIPEAPIPPTTVETSVPPAADPHRPTRMTREINLPLEVRKELLITRAALERYDCVHALHDVRNSARSLLRFGAWVPRMARPQSMWKMFGLAQKYPVLGTAVSLALPLLRRVPVLRWGVKASKWGALGGAAYWLYQTWQQARAQSPGERPERPARARRRQRQQGDAATVTADPALAAGGRDATGFHDPLVR